MGEQHRRWIAIDAEKMHAEVREFAARSCAGCIANLVWLDDVVDHALRAVRGRVR
jgi:hypothetical protein